MTLPTCRTLAECMANDGKRVAVVGLYRVWDPLPQRKLDHPPAQQVVVMLGAQQGPFLEPWGDERHMRSLDEIARFNGKNVRVVGTFLSEMPHLPSDNPDAATLGGPCIRSIEDIQIAD